MYNKPVLTYIAAVSLIFLAFACNNHQKRYDKQKSEKLISQLVEETTDSLTVEPKAAGSRPYYRKLKNGIRMHMHEYNPTSKYPDLGDVVHLNMDYYHKDSLLFTSRDFPGKFKMQLLKPKYPGSIYYALLQMHENDSAELLVEASKFYHYTRELVMLPEFIEEGDSLRFFIRNKKVVPAETFHKQEAAEMRDRKNKEDSDIRKYLLSHDLQTKEIKDRIHRTIHRKGEGTAITDKSIVTIHYIGVFTDDKPFSDTKKDDKPFTFIMGKEQVIPGLEKGLLGIKEGSKLTLIIPFDQAYGRYQEGPIPPWSTLIFHIDVIDVAESSS